MDIELEALVEAGDSTDNSHWDAPQRFGTWNEFEESVPKQSIGVYLLLSSSDLEQKAYELKQWRKFLYRLSKNGVKFVLVKCSIDGDCDSAKVTLLSIWNSKGYRNWNYVPYEGPMRPSDIFQWITETLSVHVIRAKSMTDVIHHELTRALATMVVAHYTRPLPLSYAVLAFELKGKVSFFWTETLDNYYLPDRTGLVVASKEMSFSYGHEQFLNHSELRWLLVLLTVDHADLLALVVGLFLSVVAITVPLLAEGSIWQKVKAMLCFLLLCIITAVLLAAWVDVYQTDAVEKLLFLATLLANFLKSFLSELLLLYHLFSEYPLMNLVFPFYAIVIAFNSRISAFLLPLNARMKLFFSDDLYAFVSRPFVASRPSVPPNPTSVTSASTTTLTQMPQNAVNTTLEMPFYVATATADNPSNVATATANIPSNVVTETANMPSNVVTETANMPSDVVTATANMPSNVVKETANMPSNVVKETANMPSNVAKETAPVPSNVAKATAFASGLNGCNTNDLSLSNALVAIDTQSQSSDRQNASSCPQQPEPAAISVPTQRPMLAPSVTKPFEFPPFVHSVNRELDKHTAKQMTRLKIPKSWLFPVVSNRKLALALQKSEARDQMSFEPDSATETRCLYCGTDFQPTTEVNVLPCGDIFHLGCMKEWMRAGNIDCPRCQVPLYANGGRIIQPD